MLGAVLNPAAFLDRLGAARLHDGNEALNPLEHSPLNLPLLLVSPDPGQHAPVPAVGVPPACPVSSTSVPHAGGKLAVRLLHEELPPIAVTSVAQPNPAIQIVPVSRVNEGARCLAATSFHSFIGDQLALEEPGHS